MPEKNRIAVKKLRETIKTIRNKTFPYEQKTPKKTNTTNYNQAQINEINNYLETMRDIVDLAYKRLQQKNPPNNTKRPGRPPTNTKDIVKVHLMETYFSTSDRVSKDSYAYFAKNSTYPPTSPTKP